ncbi:hypothetical protein NLU13_4245 [Sarocladium strictum]|uniref:Glutamine-dependent NAD(+) synthetase n=1 Tax=Sarocladium strictum TaxID=5046 RepID=A0AA39GJ53_SARSR|nr:hypothetical protein NLU13_4245 [Sarocladium strictum]
MEVVTVAAASLPSIPLDFLGNRDRILESIRIAKEKGATLRTGPELEIPGYGCLDHHLESDTELHSWEVLAEIISDPICKGMLIDLGMGVRHKNVQYNSRVLCTYRKVLGIRAKQSLANDGLYRETRHFTAWTKERQIEDCKLHAVIREVTGQSTAPIGDMIFETHDTSIAHETCEEMFVPRHPSIFTGLDGAEIFLNSSASHAQLRKLKERLDLITNSSKRMGGSCYIYSNCIGLDGDARVLFDGSSLICCNGAVVAQSSQFSLLKVEVITATIDLGRVRTNRSSSRGVQAAAQAAYPRVHCDITLSQSSSDLFLAGGTVSHEIEIQLLDPMEEIHLSTAVYLWNYLTRTMSGGFFLALSGGLDSSSVALMVYGMCKLVLKSIQNGEESTLSDLRAVVGIKDFMPKTAEEIVSKILFSAYMGTVNSGAETRSRAKRLAAQIGSNHMDTSIDKAVNAQIEILSDALDGFQPQYTVHGGSTSENIALQNIQARSRMVFSYALSQIITTAKGMPRAGASLLVLASTNVDEHLRGYLTKYDASSADLAPLGSISKADAARFQRWARDTWDMPIMNEFLEATPTAELLPLSAGVQSDEEEMGLRYDQLSEFGILRSIHRAGPWSAYLRLLPEWKARFGMGPREVAEKVFTFFRFYAINRHKATIITSAVHLSGYSPDDNRFDLRPYLYVVSWPWQFNKIRAHVEQMEKSLKERDNVD